MGKNDDGQERRRAKALAAVKAAKVKEAKTFAEADKRLAAARRGFLARKNAGKN